MNLPIIDPIPPIGADYIEYALTRLNNAIDHSIIRQEKDIRIQEINAIDAIVRMTLKVPVDLTVDSATIDPNDSSLWLTRYREYKRFSIQQVLDAYILTREDERPVLTFAAPITKADIKTALSGLGIVVDEAVNSIDINGAIVTITSLDPESLMWWGKGTFITMVVQT
jgi:hypothetical protein